MIFGDDVGYWNVSAYNHGMMGYKTPNIDRIAHDGALFTDYYAQQSWTAGRAAFITGQSPIRTGLTKVGLPGSPIGLQKQDPTLAELLKPQGYMTFQNGKTTPFDAAQVAKTLRANGIVDTGLPQARPQPVAGRHVPGDRAGGRQGAHRLHRPRGGKPLVALDPRERWIKAAAGWEARADNFARDTMPVSLAMVEAIQPHPGQTILDLAAGLGDTGYLAAELIEPGGQLITSDFSPEMLSAAQRRAKGTNIRFRQIDLSTPIDQEAASIDGVLCRWGYMLLEDPESALRDTRRILKQDGRLALAAWTGPDDNLWSAAPTRVLIQRGLVEPLQGPGQFTWADPNLIIDTMEAAGFVQPEVEAVDFVMRFADFDDWWTHITLTSGTVGAVDEKLDFATRSDVLADLEKLAEPFTQPDDRLEIPARTWIATATA